MPRRRTPRPSVEMGRPSVIRVEQWELPDPAELPWLSSRQHHLRHHLMVYDALGIPLGMPVYLLTFTLTVDAHPYTIAIVGTPMLPSSPPDAPRVHMDRAPEYGCPSLIAWSRKVSATASGCWLEARWHPDAGTRYTMDWPRGMPLGALNHQRTQMLLILNAIETPMGRPEGSGAYPTRDAFLGDVGPIIRTLLSEGTRPSREQVAQRYPGHTSARQLSRWAAAWGMTWGEVCRACAPGDQGM